MFKKINWQIKFGFGLIVLSSALYLLHFAIFRDAGHIFKYSLHEIAFIPIEVLVVTLIIDQLLRKRQKKAMFNKLNMVIGAFFSEVGTRLLAEFIKDDKDIGKYREALLFRADWNKKDFDKTLKNLSGYVPKIDLSKANVGQIRSLLVEKRTFLLGLLENPNLLEHESFTDLLWAVFHLSEELASRDDVSKLTANDAAHITGDIDRAYGQLVLQWLAYMKHLSRDYPYLFSFSVRTNPFNPQAKPEFD